MTMIKYETNSARIMVEEWKQTVLVWVKFVEDKRSLLDMAITLGEKDTAEFLKGEIEKCYKTIRQDLDLLELSVLRCGKYEETDNGSI